MVLADPRPAQSTSDAWQTAAEAIEHALSYAERLTLRGDTPGEHLSAVMLCAAGIVTPNPESFVPAEDTSLRYLWGRIAAHAQALLGWEPFTDHDPPRDSEADMRGAVREARLLLACSPVLGAPVCFEHAQAAVNVAGQARELATSWLDRALGYTEDEGLGVRTGQDARLLGGIVSQALIGVFCAGGP